MSEMMDRIREVVANLRRIEQKVDQAVRDAVLAWIRQQQKVDPGFAEGDWNLVLPDEVMPEVARVYGIEVLRSSLMPPGSIFMIRSLRYLTRRLAEAPYVRPTEFPTESDLAEYYSWARQAAYRAPIILNISPN